MKYFFISLYFIFIKFITCIDNSLDYNSYFLDQKCYEFCSQIGGTCTNDLKCICKKGYSTFYINEEDFYFCNYKQYNRIITGLIELVFGFGFGHFYCKRFIHGYLQLSIEFILCCLMACLISVFYSFDNIVNNGNPYYTNIISNYYFPLLALILLFWQIIDSILFFSCYYKDGNGMNLY